MGIRVYFLATVPDGKLSVPQAVRAAEVERRLPYEHDLKSYLQRNDALLNALKPLESNGKFVVVYPHRALCNQAKATCSTHSANKLFYTDSNHLSEDGARLVVRELESVMYHRRAVGRTN